ncbi:hypothetical protein LIER_10162 [Lithospermum erythrorhizon]|uniref:Pentatricopeptide repeat-containing protein n=1 Tax=Lithospermum erythrorhizon TaxID=34254 RepID=A0AAV3PMJ2_LITER
MFHFTVFQSLKLSSTLKQSQIRTYLDSSFDTKIKNLVKQGQCLKALHLYNKESCLSLNNTSKFTFPPLLKACSYLQNLLYGSIFHAKVIHMGFQFDPYIVNSLIFMYLRCGAFDTGRLLFDKVSKCESLVQDVTIWNTMLDGCLRNGLFSVGLTRFRRMLMLGVRPDGYSLSILLGVVDRGMCFEEGREIHGYVVRNMFYEDAFLVTALIAMYANNKKPVESWSVFELWGDRMNIVVSNAMINAFYENGMWRDSLELYVDVKNVGCTLMSSTFSSALCACSMGGDVEVGRQIHSDVVKMGFDSDPYACTSLLTMYSRCGLVEDAERVFNMVWNKGVELWNSMISAYINCDRLEDALNIYLKMRLGAIPSDSFTISNILASCSMASSDYFCRMIHGELIKRPVQNSVPVQSALLTMYVRCGNMEDAFGIFSRMNEKDVVAWGSMISGYCQNGNFKETLDLFKKMELGDVKPDPTLMANLVMASSGVGNCNMAYCVHGLAIKSGYDTDAIIGSSLTDFYSKCRQPEMAENIFDSIVQKNIVVWNCLMSCYCQNGLPELSLNVLSQMKPHGIHPDSVSITIALVAVSSLAALLRGKAIHGYYVRLQILDDLQVENSLLDMYIKCGCLKYTEYLFQNMPRRNIVTWNSMISGYGSHGDCCKAINLFREMTSSGITPDSITFLSLVSSCNHSGLVNEGPTLFQMMKEYKIEPTIEHYLNIVDLLGRAGCLHDAYTIISKMSLKDDKSVWLSLLSACRVHGNVDLGELAAKHLIDLEPERGSNYVQLLNLYVAAGLQEKSAELRKVMKQKGLKKVPGCSWIEVQNKTVVFYSADSSSPRILEIYEMIKTLRNNVKWRVKDYQSIEKLELS